MQLWNIAHRGGAGLMPENTMAAFVDAKARGYDGIELDVQLSADGVAVVQHDFRLMAGVARKDGTWLDAPGPRIKDLTLGALHRFDVGTPRKGSAYGLAHPFLIPTDATIPTLAEVAVLATPDFRLFVELKCDASNDSADPMTLADAAYAVTGSAAIYVGFDGRALTPLAARGATCWFTTEKLQADAHPIIAGIATAGGQGWFPNYIDATPENVAYARSLGLKVGAWTVNDPADMARLSYLDAICTDRPDLLQALK